MVVVARHTLREEMERPVAGEVDHMLRTWQEQGPLHARRYALEQKPGSGRIRG